MEFFRIRRTIPFMHYSLYLNIASVIMFCLAVFFLATKGLAFSIEFTGGTNIEVTYPSAADTDQIRKVLAKDILIRVPLKGNETSGQQAKQVMDILSAQTPGVKQHSVEFVGPQVGKQLATDGATALALVCLGIMIYLAFRFEWKFSVAAVIANMHDLVIVAGLFAFFQWEFSLQVLTSLLAVLGYSVNESVIIFDRVREHFRTMRKASTVEVINSAITATISRTVITHSSTLCMTLSMYFFGGPALHYFALALTVGICCSVYSSVFVAAAIAMYLKVKREDLVHKVKKAEISEMVP